MVNIISTTQVLDLIVITCSRTPTCAARKPAKAGAKLSNNTRRRRLQSRLNKRMLMFLYRKKPLPRLTTVTEFLGSMTTSHLQALLFLLLTRLYSMEPFQSLAPPWELNSKKEATTQKTKLSTKALNQFTTNHNPAKPTRPETKPRNKINKQRNFQTISLTMAHAQRSLGFSINPSQQNPTQKTNILKKSN